MSKCIGQRFIADVFYRGRYSYYFIVALTGKKLSNYFSNNHTEDRSFCAACLKAVLGAAECNFIIQIDKK